MIRACVSEPAGPVRPRTMNAVQDNKNFQAPKGNMTIENHKPRHIPNANIRSQETKTLQNLQPKKVVQNTKIINKVMNQQAKNTAVRPEIKRISQISPAGVNKLVAQKKKLIAAMKKKTPVEVTKDEKSLPVPTPKKITKGPMEVQKIPPTDKPNALQNAKPENDISPPNNKAQENETVITKIQNNNTSVQETKIQDDTSDSKASPAVVPKSVPTTQEPKPQDTKDDQVTTGSSAEKQTTDHPKTEVSSDNIYELDPLLGRAVEEEIRDIMIQVWQELPDDPLEEEDRIAVEKLRNEAGDDLRRVLGLNITKRLLNVYNSFFVKMQFTRRPRRGFLTSFLNKYHINKFKRIEKNSHIFAAEMENIEDFDKLCTMKELMCGEAKVTVTPCYQFTQCPTNLKTIYDDTYFYEDTSQAHTEIPKSKANTQKKLTVDTVKNENVIKQVPKVESSTSKSSEKPDITDVPKTSDSMHKDSGGVKKDLTTVEDKIANSPKIITITENTKSKDTEVSCANEKDSRKDISKDLIEFIIKDKLENVDDDDECQDEVPEYQMDGEDELNDEDILALMSEGVVLDECSGSEDEH